MENTDKRIEEKINELDRKYERTAVSIYWIIKEAIEYGMSLSKEKVKEEECGYCKRPDGSHSINCVSHGESDI